MLLRTVQRSVLAALTIAVLGAQQFTPNTTSQTKMIEPEETPMAAVAVIQEEILYAKPAPTPGRYEAIAQSITEEEEGLLALVVYHEARGESYEGQKAVVEVVFNRVLSERFTSNTVKEVIYQEGQFACASALTTAAIREPGALAIAFEVVEEVLYEKEYTLPVHYCFFSTGTKAADYIQIGNHYFR